MSFLEGFHVVTIYTAIFCYHIHSNVSASLLSMAVCLGQKALPFCTNATRLCIKMIKCCLVWQGWRMCNCQEILTKLIACKKSFLYLPRNAFENNQKLAYLSAWIKLSSFGLYFDIIYQKKYENDAVGLKMNNR